MGVVKDNNGTCSLAYAPPQIVVQFFEERNVWDLDLKEEDDKFSF